MINSSETYKKVELLKRKCGFHKVQQNAKSQGITSITLFLMIAWYDTYQWKQRIMLLNNSLDEHMHNIVLAHEIGHDHLHRKLATTGLKEFNLFDMRSIITYYSLNSRK